MPNLTKSLSANNFIYLRSHGIKYQHQHPSLSLEDTYFQQFAPFIEVFEMLLPPTYITFANMLQAKQQSHRQTLNMAKMTNFNTQNSVTSTHLSLKDLCFAFVIKPLDIFLKALNDSRPARTDISTIYFYILAANFSQVWVQQNILRLKFQKHNFSQLWVWVS